MADSIFFDKVLLKLDSIQKLQGQIHLKMENVPVENWWPYIFIAGLFGAVSGYVYKLTVDMPIWQPIEALKSLVLGITAAFMGPLLLYFLHSKLLDQIKTSEEGIFYLIGFSLLTSMFGQYFIEKLKGIFDAIKQQENRIKILEIQEEQRRK